MHNKLLSRKIKKEDWSTLEKWWRYWLNSDAPPKDYLPDNGTSGIIIEDNGQPVVAGFIYQTNSKLAILEGLISNPKYRGKKNRDKAIEVLIACLQDAVKLMGYKYIFVMTDNKKIIENLKIKFDWSLNSKPHYSLTKIL